METTIFQGESKLTAEKIQDLPDTPLQEVRPTRGRFNSPAVIPLLQQFYRPEQIQSMRERRVDDRMMFGINPYFMALVKGEEYRTADGELVLPAMPPSSPLEALVVPIMAEADDMSGELDPSYQIRYSPQSLKGKILHKYDEIVLGYAALACSAHCRYCYRLDIFNGSTGKGLIKPAELTRYIKDYNESLASSGNLDRTTGEPRYPIREVLLSGGDPMILSNKNLYKYMAAAADAGVHTVRIGTKEFSFRPQRFDANFANLLELFHSKFPDVHVNFVVHFTHPDEFLARDLKNDYVRNSAGYYQWLPPVRAAVDLVNKFDFVSLENQTPIISRVNDDADSLRLLHEELRRGNVKPKYTFQCREIEGHKAFAVPMERAWRLHNESQKGLSDTARSRFALSTEAGKLELVSVVEGRCVQVKNKWCDVVPAAFEDGFVIMKFHRSPHSANSQGDIIIAKRNPLALWLSDYEDRILYDGRKQRAQSTAVDLCAHGVDHSVLRMAADSEYESCTTQAIAV